MARENGCTRLLIFIGAPRRVVRGIAGDESYKNLLLFYYFFHYFSRGSIMVHQILPLFLEFAANILYNTL